MSEHDESSFPDVQVGLQRLTSTGNEKDDEQVTILQLGPARPQRPPAPRGQNGPSAPVDAQKVDSTAAASKRSEQPNRRQRHKQQKMKTKYKDQDEEERELRIELLGSSGQPKQDRKAQRKAKKSGNKPTSRAFSFCLQLSIRFMPLLFSDIFEAAAATNK